MKAVLITIGVAVSAAVCVAADEEKHVSKEGRFAVSFPKGAKVKTDAKKTASGLDMNSAMVENKGVLHAVIYADVPEEGLKNLKLFFDSVERGIVRSSGAKVSETKEIEFGPDKLPGRKVSFEKDATHGRLVLILNKDRFFAVILRGSKEFIDSKEAKAFFESFELK